MPTVLLITSPSEPELIKATANYYGGATITLHGDNYPKAVHNGLGPIPGMEVHRVLVAGRHRYQLRRRAVPPCRAHG